MLVGEFYRILETKTPGFMLVNFSNPAELEILCVREELNLHAVFQEAYIAVSLVYCDKAWLAFYGIVIKFLPARTMPPLRADRPEEMQDLLDIVELRDPINL
jgi:hypothetical protein